MKLKNIILAFKDQLPFKRLMRNIFTGRIRGVLSKRSHMTKEGKLKIMYNTEATAIRSAKAMAEKKGVRFDPYKCLWCDGYHIGKNRAGYTSKSVILGS